MEVDILRRRIAVIEACEHRKELRRAAGEGVQSDQREEEEKRPSAYSSEQVVIDWEEPAIR